MSNEAFRPAGNSLLILVSSSTGQAAQQLSTAGSHLSAWLANPSTVPVYVAVGGTSLGIAGVPTTGTPAPGMCLPAGVGKAVNVGPANNWLSAVTSAGSAILFATPGSGW